VTSFMFCGLASSSIPLTWPWHPFSSKPGKCSCSKTGDPSAAQELAWQALENLRQQQASSLAYFDVFLLLAVATLAVMPAVLLMKRSVAEKGAHIGHE
jgi:MFS transporter, DHA2 family, multidrug resistance protein